MSSRSSHRPWAVSSSLIANSVVCVCVWGGVFLHASLPPRPYACRQATQRQACGQAGGQAGGQSVRTRLTQTATHARTHLVEKKNMYASRSSTFPVFTHVASELQNHARVTLCQSTGLPHASARNLHSDRGGPRGICVIMCRLDRGGPGGWAWGSHSKC